MPRKLRLWCMALIVLAVAAPSVSHAETLIVQIASNLQPQVDFDVLRVSLQGPHDTEPSQVRERFYFRDEEFDGTRAMEFTVAPTAPLESWRVVAQVINGSGFVVDTRRIAAAVPPGVVHIATALLDRPERSFTKSDTLFLDLDDDGMASAGDTMLYTFEVIGPQASGIFVDRPGPGTTLYGGRVFSTGTVLSGEDEGDEEVIVDLGPLAPGELGGVSFFTEVTPAVGTQGTLRARFDTTHGGRNVRIPSDDPETAGEPDATMTQMGRGPLDFCASLLATVEGELAVLTGDPDDDGVVAARDACDGTAAGLAVDDRGCSQVQFCATIGAAYDVDTGPGQDACTHADWTDDEPDERDPGDCVVRDGFCEPF